MTIQYNKFKYLNEIKSAIEEFNMNAKMSKNIVKKIIRSIGAFRSNYIIIYFGYTYNNTIRRREIVFFFLFQIFKLFLKVS